MENVILRDGMTVEVYDNVTNTYRKATVTALSPDNVMTYVHFQNTDKRNDVWVQTSKISIPVKKHLESGFEPPDLKARETDSEISDDDQPIEILDNFQRVHARLTKVRNIDHIIYNDVVIKCWYYSPYMPSYANTSSIYVCDHCADYFLTKESLDTHKIIKKETHPPGKEIYRKGNVSIFELHGQYQKYACQSLSLLGKLFLDHKTLFYDVEGFIFYVLCECDANGAHIAAFISKEIISEAGNVLACIIVLPPFQKKGYGRTLISLAYEISRRQKKSGSPERPLSDLGKLAFYSYWRDAVISTLVKGKDNIKTIQDIILRTAMTEHDIRLTLKDLGYLREVNGELVIIPRWDDVYLRYNNFLHTKANSLIDPNLLIWDPNDQISDDTSDESD